MPTSNFYSIQKKDNFIIYNNAKIAAFEVDAKGKQFFDLILKYKNIVEAKNNLD